MPVGRVIPLENHCQPPLRIGWRWFSWGYQFQLLPNQTGTIYILWEKAFTQLSEERLLLCCLKIKKTLFKHIGQCFLLKWLFNSLLLCFWSLEHKNWKLNAFFFSYIRINKKHVFLINLANFYPKYFRPSALVICTVTLSRLNVHSHHRIVGPVSWLWSLSVS